MDIWIMGGIVLGFTALQDAEEHTISNYSIALLFLCGAASILRCGSWLSAIAGMAVCGFPILILSLVIRRGYIGGGDVKLCGALGFFLGPYLGILVILMALMIMSAYGLVRRKVNQLIPFAPFVFPAYLISPFLLLV